MDPEISRLSVPPELTPCFASVALNRLWCTVGRGGRGNARKGISRDVIQFAGGGQT